MLELIAAPNTQRWLLFGRARPKRAGRPGRRAGEASGLGRSVGHFGCNANDNDPHGLSTTVNRYAVLRTSFQKDFVGRQLICPTFHQKPSTKTTRDAQLGCTCACQFSFSREERLAIYVRPRSSLSGNYRPAAKTPPPNRVTTSNSEAPATKSLANFSHDANSSHSFWALPLLLLISHASDTETLLSKTALATSI